MFWMYFSIAYKYITRISRRVKYSVSLVQPGHLGCRAAWVGWQRSFYWCSAADLLNPKNLRNKKCSPERDSMRLLCYAQNQCIVTHVQPYLPGSQTSCVYIHQLIIPVLQQTFLMEQTLFWCCPCQTVEEGHIAFWSNSWAFLRVMCGPYPTHKPQTSLSCSSFTHTFT